MNSLKALKNRLLQLVAQFAPGARSVRVLCHRWRGVHLGKNVWIGYDTVIETSRPHLVFIGDNSIISIRAILIAHFRGATGLRIEEDVFIGPGAILLPGITIGRGAVVTAGSVVSSSVAPMTVVQGNPARPVARNAVTLVGDETSLQQFSRSLRPIKPQQPGKTPPS